MLRVGLTGGLGSGKSTVAGRLAALGAHVIQADELARELMQPGQKVYQEIVERFGPSVVRADGVLNRAVLANLAFSGGRLAELNAIVHPATIERQEQLIAELTLRQPEATVVVESALLFETAHGDWRTRFHCVVLVTAPEAAKIARFVARSGGGDESELIAEARRRLAAQMLDEQKLALADFVVRNDGTVSELQNSVEVLWKQLCNFQSH